MTKKGLFKKITFRIAFILALVSVVCFSAFFLVACGDEESSSSSSKTYTYSETDTTPISNSSFAYGTKDSNESSFPKTSITGWSRAVDNSARSSAVNSGVIDITENGWKNTIDVLFKDDDFKDYAKAVLKSKSIDFDDDNLLDKIKSDVFAKPSTHDGMNDFNVYMLNNYLSKERIGVGTAQTITSNSTVTLEKGSYAKISVWVMTQNLAGINADGDLGANLRLTSTFNGTTQAQFKLSNINTLGEWKQYSVYVKADKDFTTTVKVVLGLGYGSGSSTEAKLYTEGTAYFDDLTYTILSESEFNDEVSGKSPVTNNMNYGDTEDLNNSAKSFNADNEYYIFNLNTDALFNEMENPSALSVSGTDTKAKGTSVTAKTIFTENDTAKVETNVNTYTVSGKTADSIFAYTLTLSSDDFAVGNGNYAFVTFLVKNSLSKFHDSCINVSILDKANGVEIKRDSLIDIAEISEDWVRVCLLVKNNFEEGNAREFDVIIEIGPTESELASLTHKYQFAKGTVEIKDVKFKTGVIDKDAPEFEKVYDLFNSVSKVQALYAGFDSDNSSSNDKESYSLAPAAGNIGEITAYPTTPQNYEGIVANHIYVLNGDNLEININTRSGKNGNATDGYAGLINTKYLGNYDGALKSAIESALLGAYTEGEDIQPLMIYNTSADHYGYVGSSNSVSENSYAKVSVTLRVVDTASAFVYLVNTGSSNKNVMTFNDFKTNTDGIKYTEETAVNGSDLKFALKVTSDMMDSNGWATVTFYIATGNQAKNFRVEIWNGGRTVSEDASEGFVFVSDVKVSTTGAFVEPDNFNNAFTTEGNPLFEAKRSSFNDNDIYAYKRVLTSTEKSFNSEYPESAVNYKASYVWAKNANMIYAIFNTLDVEETNPYDTIKDDVDDEEDSETSDVDSANFWLAFSSILLAVVLIAAIIALVVKNARSKAKANKSDAKSHYSITSRANVLKSKKEKSSDKAEEIIEETEESSDEEQPEVSEEIEQTENTEENTNPEEQKLDEYLYGEVQDFGETVTNQEQGEETEQPENSENPSEETKPEDKE